MANHLTADSNDNAAIDTDDGHAQNNRILLPGFTVQDFSDGTITDIDGIRVDFEDGWGLVRASNTSPVLSLRFEADGQTALDRIQERFAAALAAIDPKLKFK